MKTLLATISLLLLSALGFGQAPADRTEKIWEVIDQRFVRQLDAWWDDGEFPRCIQLLRVQNQLDPSDYDTATNLGWMFENVEKWDEALATYIRFREQNPNQPDHALPEAEYYFRKKLFAKVPPILEPTMKLKPHANAWRILAHSYDRLGLLKDSERIWKAYIQLNPEDPQAKNNLARVQRKIAGA